MKTFLQLLAWIAILAAQCSATYVIVNNDNPAGNSVSVYVLDSGGVLHPYKVLSTGGTGGGMSDYGWTGQAVGQNASCGFVADTGSNDIASFSEARGFAKVGNYSNSALVFNGFGSTIALTQSGKFLYAAYSGSGNIGAWAVNKDCSLTFIAAYTPSMGIDIDYFLRTTPNSQSLVVVGEYLARAELFSINQTTGTLTDVGFVDFPSSTNGCNGYGCAPAGIDITSDGKFAILANAVQESSALSVEITSSGLTNPQVWPLAVSDLSWAEVPFLSAAAYKGNGNVYFSMAGQGYTSPGVITATLQESNGGITIVFRAETVIQNTPIARVGGIAASGDLMVVVEPLTGMQVFQILESGQLEPDNGIFNDPQAYALTNLALFPNTR